MASASDQAEPLPDESTALLAGRSTPSSPPQFAIQPPLAAINPLSAQIQRQGLHILDEVTSSPSLSSPAEKTAYKLLVCLRLWAMYQILRSAKPDDVYMQWEENQERIKSILDLETRIYLTWKDFIEEGRVGDDIHACLWTAFPLEEGDAPRARVVDFLALADSSPTLLFHSLVSLSLSHSWKYGRHGPLANTLLGRLAQQYDELATPRGLHFIDFAIQLGYLALLIYYILRPPDRPILALNDHRVDARAVALIVYSFASICRASSPYIVPSLLVFVSFIYCLPAFPYAGESPYIFILAALVLHILSLHLPIAPGLNFIMPPRQNLPLATLLWTEFTTTFSTILLFYFPAFLLASYLLSIALADSIPQGPDPDAFRLLAAPMETRQGFVALWIVIFLLIIVSTGQLIIFKSSSNLSDQPSDPWDRYSKPVGLRARRIFIRALTDYSTPYFFPVPFNLLQVLLIRLPSGVLHWTAGVKLRVVYHAEAVLWRVTVGPIAMLVEVVSLIWRSS